MMYTTRQMEYCFALFILCAMTDVYSWTVSPFNLTSNTSTIEPRIRIQEELGTTIARDSEHVTDHASYSKAIEPGYIAVILFAICAMIATICLRLIWKNRFQQKVYRAMDGRQQRAEDGHTFTIESSNISLDDPPPSYEQCVAYTDPPSYDQLPPQYQMTMVSHL